jgi:DNA-binding transcriptional LysR family regulator
MVLVLVNAAHERLLGTLPERMTGLPASSFVILAVLRSGHPPGLPALQPRLERGVVSWSAGRVLSSSALFHEAHIVACAPDYLAAHRIEEPADLARCAVLSIDKECAWWERFLGAFPKSRRPAYRRVVAISHLRGLITAAASDLGVLLAPSYSLRGELDRGALVALFPTIRPLEDRFALYQKSGKVRLERHRLLTNYLQEMTPAEFGALVSLRARGSR